MATIDARTESKLHVSVPGEAYHANLISCQRACPVHTDARGYVRAIADGRFDEAYLIARGPNPFASICGRVCGAPCEAACRRGQVPRVDDDGRFVGKDRPIAIRALKRFACETAGPETRGAESVVSALRGHVPAVAADADEMAALLRAAHAGRIVRGTGQRVAIVGAGPAGLSAAHDLALLGFAPIVFESEAVPAGMLAVGVPAYRLPRDVIAQEVAVIRALGVEIRCGVTVGNDISFAELRRNHAAVIIAVGAKSSRALGLPGERGPGVYGGVDLLRAVALGAPLDLGRKVVVVGGGNVAYDVARSVVRQIAYDTARTAARLPSTSKVTLVSLEDLETMPADTIEILEGDEEGVGRLNGWGPIEIVRGVEGQVIGVTFKRCLRVYDEQRRFAPIFDETDRRTVACDTVLLAVGQAPATSFLEDGGQDVAMARPGWPKVDPATLQTSAPGVFAAGDLAHGTRLLIDAVASGKAAARAVYTYLTGRPLHAATMTAHLTLPAYRRERGYESIRRQAVPVREASDRLSEPHTQVELGYDALSAMREASRCLDCGVTPVFDDQWRRDSRALAAELACDDLRRCVGSIDDAATAAQYYSVFGPGGPAPPREASYHQSLELGSLMTELAAYYDAFGYAPQSPETPDHVALEVGFVAYLKLKEAFARVRGDHGQADVTARAASQFTADHLARVATPLARLLAGSQLRYLAEASRLLAERVGPPPISARLAIHPVTDGDADRDMECGPA